LQENHNACQDKYEKRLGLIWVYAFLGAFIGFFCMYSFGITYLSKLYNSNLYPDQAQKILSTVIPADRYYLNITGTARTSKSGSDVIIGAYEFEKRAPRTYYTGSPDLTLGTKEMTLLETVVAGIADPFMYQPFEINNETLISGLVYAANPTYNALTVVKNANQLWSK
jgi:hypothetical protein